jgi:hypothetical protein
MRVLGLGARLALRCNVIPRERAQQDSVGRETFGGYPTIPRRPSRSALSRLVAEFTVYSVYTDGMDALWVRFSNISNGGDELDGHTTT